MLCCFEAGIRETAFGAEARPASGVCRNAGLQIIKTILVVRVNGLA